MANIHGINAGLIPVEVPETRPKPRPKKELSKCSVCGGTCEQPNRAKFNWRAWEEISTLNLGDWDGMMSRWWDDPVCKHCLYLLWDLHQKPHLTRDLVSERVPKARESGWVMSLVSRAFGERGYTFNVDLGDVFKVKRSGRFSDGPNTCSRRRSKDTMSVSVSVGPFNLTLFAHEFSPMTMFEILELRTAGELTEEFLATNDEVGYFTPGAELRAQIRNVFGSR